VRIYVAGSLITVKNGYALTIILNTNDREVEIPEPRLRLAKIEGVTRVTEGIDQENKYRGKDVLAKLRLEHLNNEE
jgi:hypothetical protein